ncbi:MAG TPA: amidohydrolase family protein [Syntrophales bacterium]|nr:amidohydrolase family protein [Syntrophales bacterium]
MMIIDSHMHCGVQNSNLPVEDIKRYLDSAGIQGACLFAPVEDIYDRYDYDFKDNFAWVNCRQHANQYVLDIQRSHHNFFAYYFVWNDFRKDELKKGYKAVKWHRHEYEPVYHYDDPLCEAFLQEVYRLKLPVVLEESFANTRSFIRRVGGRTTVIIPHLGGLNGGFSALFKSGTWDDEMVYADTALASRQEIAQFIVRYGSRRILFGSDFPFGTPGGELQEVLEINLGKEDFENIVCHNILRLLNV